MSYANAAEGTNHETLKSLASTNYVAVLSNNSKNIMFLQSIHWHLYIYNKIVHHRNPDSWVSL